MSNNLNYVINFYNKMSGYLFTLNLNFYDLVKDSQTLTDSQIKTKYPDIFNGIVAGFQDINTLKGSIRKFYRTIEKSRSQRAQILKQVAINSKNVYLQYSPRKISRRKKMKIDKVIPYLTPNGNFWIKQLESHNNYPFLLNNFDIVKRVIQSKYADTEIIIKKIKPNSYKNINQKRYSVFGFDVGFKLKYIVFDKNGNIIDNNGRYANRTPVISLNSVNLFKSELNQCLDDAYNFVFQPIETSKDYWIYESKYIIRIIYK
ncbi:MAG: hypothetical protein ACTSQS_11545 [Promethearchaeota archaeon]